MKRLGWIALVAVACGSPAPAPMAPVVQRGPASPVVSSAASPEPQPPVAARRPHTVKSVNGDRDDPYYWLRDDTRKNPDVLGYVEAENAYTRAVLGPYKELEDKLLAELKGHVADDDDTAPVLVDGYWLYRKFAAGQEQPVIVRRKATMQAPEEVVLDGNELARGHAFFRLGEEEISHDGRFVAWTDDTVGRRQYALHIKDLRTGQVLADTATNVAPNFAWANDHKTVFYVGKDATTLREDRVLRHTIGEAKDPEVYHEADGQFSVAIVPTMSQRYVQILLGSTTMTETQLIDADHPRTPPRVTIPRAKDHLYSLDHLDGAFVIMTNAEAKNFRLVSVPEAKIADRKAWRDVIAARPDAMVTSFTISRHFIAATVRTGGLSKVAVIPVKHGVRGPVFFVDTDEPAYAMWVDNVPGPERTQLRYTYNSMVTPRSTFELDPASHARTTIKTQAVPSYDASKYVTEYLHATASDGTLIPISVVHRKDVARDGHAPTMVYGYGSYGLIMEPMFDPRVLPLLDRGWVWATAHVRGGQEMGRAWYDEGKLNKKRNTFTDFIAATEFLVTQKYADPAQVFAQGRSAGGLLMGAVLNLRPDLYRGVVAGVPFVDVVTTMLDESIPLTSGEYDEWGNPKDKAAYDYMLSYSPYDNVKPQPYPSIFVTTSLWDSQVQYFEPAKWVAKLRATRTDHNPVLLETDMAAGHGGKSGRYDSLRDTARWMTFVLRVHGTRDRRRDGTIRDPIEAVGGRPLRQAPSARE